MYLLIHEIQQLLCSYRTSKRISFLVQYGCGLYPTVDLLSKKIFSAKRINSVAAETIGFYHIVCYLISTPDFIVLSVGWCIKYQGISKNRHSVLVIVSGHTITQDKSISHNPSTWTFILVVPPSCSCPLPRLAFSSFT